MIYTSLAVLALSASAAVSPLSKMVHMHPHSAQPDTRISLTIANKAIRFQDIKVDGRSYTVQAHQSLLVKAPAGTIIYADSSYGPLHRGDVIAQLMPQSDQQTIVLK
jgi:hypothetical protein